LRLARNPPNDDTSFLSTAVAGPRVGLVHDRQSVVPSGAIGGVRVTSPVALPPTTKAAEAASTRRNERDNQPADPTAPERAARGQGGGTASQADLVVEIEAGRARQRQVEAGETKLVLNQHKLRRLAGLHSGCRGHAF
jgi:hypothetical protein